jgi:RNA polymerase sigma-70 factor (ECF subfamily)
VEVGASFLLMIDNLPISDSELFSAFKKGNQSAFKSLYERYWQLLYVSACKVIKDEDEAKDIVQEVFISMLGKASQLEIQGSVANYLYTAVRYKVFDAISRQKVRTDYAESITDFVTNQNYTTDRMVLEKEITFEIEKEIQNLPKKMKEVFELSRKSDLSHREIAEILKISDKTVKKQISNAIKLLKPKFNNYYMVLIVGFWGYF